MTLYLVCIFPDPPFPASGELDRASAGGRDDLRHVCYSLGVDRPPPSFPTPWRIRGRTSLHSQGRRER
jgi:hypothetical protein